jgi:beta-glucosidase
MDLNDVPATGNRWLLHDVLRDTWHYRGFVVSDANAVHSLITHGYARDGQDAALKAFSAGLDMDMASGTYLKYLSGEVKQGRISRQQIDDAVLAILEAKIRLGLFEHPFVDESQIPQVLNAPESQELARAAVQRSVVLLRNEQGLLPLDKRQIRSIAVIGPLADAELDLLGMWGAMTKPGPTVTILQGIKNKVGGAVRVDFAHGPNIRRDIPSFFEDVAIVPVKEQPQQTPEQARKALDAAVATAKRNDIAVLVLGEIAHEWRGGLSFFTKAFGRTRGTAESRGRDRQAGSTGVGQWPAAGYLLGRGTCSGNSGGMVCGKPGGKRNRGRSFRRCQSGRTSACELAAQFRRTSALLQPHAHTSARG